MKKEEIESIVKKQREFFDSGKTHNTEFRINALKKLRFTIKKFVISLIQSDGGTKDL